jgi:hypothetical protein
VQNSRNRLICFEYTQRSHNLVILISLTLLFAINFVGIPGQGLATTAPIQIHEVAAKTKPCGEHFDSFDVGSFPSRGVFFVVD